MGLFGKIKAKKLLKEAVRLHEEKNFQAAEQKFREALKNDPEYYEIHLNYAYLLEDLERYDEAIKEYNAALKGNPSSVEAWTGLGAVYHRMRQYGKAIEAYKKAVEANPDYITAWINLATCQIDHGYYPEAHATLEEALKHTSDPEMIELIKSKMV